MSLQLPFKPINVALTREEGSNSGLADLLSTDSRIQCHEIPCIEFKLLKGNNKRLLDTISDFDLITITSPHSAKVFCTTWADADRPRVNIATVGRGTSKVIEQIGLSSCFEPSDATAECLSTELPEHLGKRILFPTSTIASDSLESGLRSRGFDVTRLDVYSTSSPILTLSQLQIASHVDIVSLASPSAARTWAEQLGTDFTAVAIGPSSLLAAQKFGFRDVFAPEGDSGPVSQGMEPWARLIQKLAGSILENDKDERNSMRGAEFWR